MRKGGVYKHENNTEVAAMVLRVVFIPEKKGYKVKISWLNIVNPRNVYPCGVTEEVFVKAEDMKKWKPLDEPRSTLETGM